MGDFGLAEDVYSVGYFRQDVKKNIKLPYKWMALESLTDSVFSEKTDVVILGLYIACNWCGPLMEIEEQVLSLFLKTSGLRAIDIIIYWTVCYLPNFFFC